MPIRYEQLGACLRDASVNVFLVSGDEPFQRIEAQDRIRQTLRARGYDERQVFSVEPQFQWADVSSCCENLSLFSTRRLIELRAVSGKLGADGAKFLATYQASEDRALVVEMPRLSRDQLSAAWVKNLESIGVFLQVWPIVGGEFRSWLAGRAESRKLTLSSEALSALAERTEGNLLAAAQEIDMLALLYGEADCDQDAVLQMAGESARYQLDQLLEAAMQGNLSRAASVLYGLRAESAEPILVNWNVAQMLRDATAAERGSTVFNKSRLYQNALRVAQRRRDIDWSALLRRCARIDRINKGAEPGRVWDELLELLIEACGRQVKAAG